MAFAATSSLPSKLSTRQQKPGRRSTIVYAKEYVRVPSNYKPKQKPDDGGNDWFSVTRRAAQSVSNPTPSSLDEKMEQRRQKVKRYVDRADLYEGNWEGSTYVGSRFNVLNVLLLIAIGTPILGLIFAYLTYGTVWG